MARCPSCFIRLPLSGEPNCDCEPGNTPSAARKRPSEPRTGRNRATGHPRPRQRPRAVLSMAQLLQLRKPSPTEWEGTLAAFREGWPPTVGTTWERIKRMKRETVYISGPMSGLPNFNYPAFDAKSDELCDRYWVRNPAWILAGDSWTWQHWMRAAIQLQMDADVVHMLPGWRKSRGARIERRLALILGQRVEGADA